MGVSSGRRRGSPLRLASLNFRKLRKLVLE